MNIKNIMLSAGMLAAALMLPPQATAATGAMLTWQRASGHLETGYAGLGNQNEVIAIACYEVPTANTTSTFTVNAPAEYDYITETSGGSWWRTTYNYTQQHFSGNVAYTCHFTQIPADLDLGAVKVNYTLTGNGLSFVTGVRVWARPLSGTVTWTTSGNYDDTFAIPFDSRDPQGNQGAILLGEASGNATAGTITGSGQLEKGRKYVFYLTVNLSDNLDALQPMTQGMTKVGGRITHIGLDVPAGTSLPYEGYYDYDTYAGGTATGVSSSNRHQKTTGRVTTSGTINLSDGQEFNVDITYDNASAMADGSRVLVPGREVLFSPGDHYSKFYRIPAITSTTTGHLVAISDARKHYAHDIANDIDMLCRVSTDLGRTWGPIQTVQRGEARDRNGSALALDDNGVPVDISKMVCSQSVGYGDAAVAALPNGNVLVCMVEGGAIAGTGSDNPSYASWCILNDRGEVVRAKEHIPEALYTAVGDGLYTASRGCIAPGNMCVVKNGPLAGKVMSAMRVIGTDGSGSQKWGNIFLIYDPETQTWNSFRRKSDGLLHVFQLESDYTAGGNHDDEAQLAELDTWTNGDHQETSFLMSIRRNGGERRFVIISAYYDQANGYYTGTTKRISRNTDNCQNHFVTAANGVQMHYTDEDGHDWLLHTAISSNAAAPASGRSNLTLNYTTIGTINNGQETFALNHNSTEVGFTDGISLSDPLQQRDETAQYSSMTRLPDGTIGLLFEEYPMGIRNDVTHQHETSSTATNGDYLLQSVFLRLRINDIVPNTTAPAIKVIAAPTIEPHSQAYDTNALDRASNPLHPDIVITRSGDSGDGILTHYTITYTGTNGRSIELATDVYGATINATQDWNALKALMTANSVTPEAGSSITVTAYCYRLDADGIVDAQSNEVSEKYAFHSPTRRVLIQAHNVASNSGYGSPQLQSSGQTVGINTAITAGVGTNVSVASNDGGKYVFEAFTLGETTESDRRLVNGVNNVTDYGRVTCVMSQGGKAVDFDLPDAQTLLDNYDTDGDGQPDALCVHVWYSYSGAAVGVKTQVFTAYEGAVNTADGSLFASNSFATTNAAYDTQATKEVEIFNGRSECDYNTTVLRRRFFDRTVSYPAQADADGVIPNHGIARETAYVPANWNDGGTTSDYSQGYGMHVCVSVLPDNATARDFNAVVMFASEQGTDESTHTHTYLRDASGHLIYALLQGQTAPNTHLVTGAQGRVFPWYVTDAQGTFGALANDDISTMTHPAAVDQNKRAGLYGNFAKTIAPATSNVPVTDGTTTQAEQAFQGMHFYDLDQANGFTFGQHNDDVLYAVVYVVTEAVQDAEDLVASDASSHRSPAVYTLYHPITVKAGATTGVESLTGHDTAKGPVEWYNMQGQRVSHPQEGNYYLRRQGTKASKVLYHEQH